MISNSNWTEWSTIQGVIARVISVTEKVTEKVTENVRGAYPRF